MSNSNNVLSPQTAPGFGTRMGSKRASCDTSPSRPAENFMSLERVQIEGDAHHPKRASVAVGSMVRDSNASGTVGLSQHGKLSPDRMSVGMVGAKANAATNAPTSIERTIDARAEQ